MVRCWPVTPRSSPQLPFPGEVTLEDKAALSACIDELATVANIDKANYFDVCLKLAEYTSIPYEALVNDGR